MGLYLTDVQMTFHELKHLNSKSSYCDSFIKDNGNLRTYHGRLNIKLMLKTLQNHMGLACIVQQKEYFSTVMESRDLVPVSRPVF